MASKSSIAIRQDAAIKRSIEAIRALWGDELEIPLRFRDPTMLGMLQLEAIAEYLSRKAYGTVTTSVPVDWAKGSHVTAASVFDVTPIQPTRTRKPKAKAL